MGDSKRVMMKLAIVYKALIVAVLTMNSSVSSLSPSPSMRTVSTVFPEAKHRVDASQVQYNFDSNIPPVVKVDQGDFVHVETQDCFGGQITPQLEHPTRAVNNIPRSKLNPVSFQSAQTSKIPFVYRCPISLALYDSHSVSATK